MGTTVDVGNEHHTILIIFFVLPLFSLAMTGVLLSIGDQRILHLLLKFLWLNFNEVRLP